MCHVDEPVVLLCLVCLNGLTRYEHQLVLVPDANKTVVAASSRKQSTVRGKGQVEDRVGRSHSPDGLPITGPGQIMVIIFQWEGGGYKAVFRIRFFFADPDKNLHADPGGKGKK